MVHCAEYIDRVNHTPLLRLEPLTPREPRRPDSRPPGVLVSASPSRPAAPGRRDRADVLRDPPDRFPVPPAWLSPSRRAAGLPDLTLQPFHEFPDAAGVGRLLRERRPCYVGYRPPALLPFRAAAPGRPRPKGRRGTA